MGKFTLLRFKRAFNLQECFKMENQESNNQHVTLSPYCPLITLGPCHLKLTAVNGFIESHASGKLTGSNKRMIFACLQLGESFLYENINETPLYLKLPANSNKFSHTYLKSNPVRNVKLSFVKLLNNFSSFA